MSQTIPELCAHLRRRCDEAERLGFFEGMTVKPADLRLLLDAYDEARAQLDEAMGAMWAFGGYAKCAKSDNTPNTPEYVAGYWQRFNEFEATFDKLTALRGEAEHD